jgi:hypothetical protein
MDFPDALRAAGVTAAASAAGECWLLATFASSVLLALPSAQGGTQGPDNRFGDNTAAAAPPTAAKLVSNPPHTGLREAPPLLSWQLPRLLPAAAAASPPSLATAAAAEGIGTAAEDPRSVSPEQLLPLLLPAALLPSSASSKSSLLLSASLLLLLLPDASCSTCFASCSGSPWARPAKYLRDTCQQGKQGSAGAYS